jgi:hypothetical protein
MRNRQLTPYRERILSQADGRVPPRWKRDADLLAWLDSL